MQTLPKKALFATIFIVAGICASFAQSPSGTLVEKAQSEGTIRVIARLSVPYQPEPDLNDDQKSAQRAAVNAAQQGLGLALAGIDITQTFDTLPLVVLELDAEGVELLLDTDLVDVVVEDTLAAPTLVDSGPLINAPAAWGAGFEGAGQHVAILDTGVEASHPFLAGKVVSEACFSTTSSANGGSTSLCPNGQDSQIGANAGRDCATTVSGCGHGTHVAGIAAGNGPDFSGVARKARIIAIQVFTRFNSAATCSPRPAPCALSYTSDQIRGLERVRDLAGSLQIAAVNMSLGGGKSAAACDSDPRKPIIDTLRTLKIATVIASGNDGFSDGVGFPSCISSAISVGSTTKSDTVSSFSNSAAVLDMLAPGQGINASVIGGGFGQKSGTSMATPQVAGAVAVARSADPSASVSDLLAQLKSNGKPVTGKGVTKPRLDLAYLAIGRGAPDAGGPLAFGTVWFDGQKQSGTANWSGTYNSTLKRYEISISGENYHYLRYSTIVTPAGDTRFCKSSSVGGKLLVYCYQENGQAAQSRFAFVTFKE